MLLGVMDSLQRVLPAPVICTLQGEAPFLDALSEPYKGRAWSLLSQKARAVDSFVAVSGFTGKMMADRLRLDSERVDVVHNGIDLADFAALEHIPPERPTLGFLARMCPDKGLHTLVEAWLEIARRGKVPLPRLRAAGVELAVDRPYVEELRARIAAAGLAEHADFSPNVTSSQKLALLTGLTVFSVPATYGESFGLYLLEALASGVPVVQPRDAAFPELIERTGGGLLCEPDDPASLADALEELLGDPERARALGATGRRAVLADFGAERMARDFEAVLRRRLPAARSPRPIAATR
jgi:glycosyltransferase involved in cell wall biosynthesis